MTHHYTGDRLLPGGFRNPMDGSTSSSAPTELDLRTYSESNYERNRRARATAITIAVGVVLAFVALFSEVLEAGLNHPWEFGAALILIVGGTPTVYLAFAMPLAYYKWYLRPPVGLRVTPDTLVFEMVSGGEISFPSAEPYLRLSLTVYSDAARARPESRICLVVRRGRRDTGFVWRRILPFTYLPPEAVPAILGWGRRVGLELYETAGPVIYSRTEPDWRNYRLTHPGPG
jgi:hypothetical protein